MISFLDKHTSYIIGDAAYLLKTWLLTGFKDNGHLTAQQIRLTHLLSSKRMIVERSIGLLKGRFRKLKVIADVDRTRFLPKLITAACMHTPQFMHLLSR